MSEFTNPFRPGAGHQPPYLAGRDDEQRQVLRLLEQDTILDNAVVTGLRGVGKTVLLDSLKPSATARDWVWIGTDLGESASISERNIATRLCTDLAIATSTGVLSTVTKRAVGFAGEATQQASAPSRARRQFASANCWPPGSLPLTTRLEGGAVSTAQPPSTLTYDGLISLYEYTPGLPVDKLKAVIEFSWQALSTTGARGIVFAYDEAQNLADHAKEKEFPLSLLLDTFQSIQRRGTPALLILTGLPTLFPKLVQARTFSERMFRSISLGKLSPNECREAILKPIEGNRDLRLKDQSVEAVISLSGGYPYFIQFICREVYDAFVRRVDRGEQASVPVAEIERKLDADFFAGRWAKATERQRDLLAVIAQLDHAEDHFTVKEIIEKARELPGKAFSSSHISQLLTALSAQGLVFKDGHGRYLFAVPMLAGYIRRRHAVHPS